jgi:hypothetical protein
MNVRMRSMSVLPVVLPFFLVAAALTHSLTLAAVAQNRAQKESASFKNIKETVSKSLVGGSRSNGGNRITDLPSENSLH